MKKAAHTYPFPAHYVTTDIVVFTFRDERLQVLLIRRGEAPFKGQWALPGGFLRPDEELEDCARRELSEETSLREFFLEPFATVGTVGRDPRGRVITVVHLALVRWAAGLRGGTDATDAAWHRVDALPKLAFDHAGLVRAARARMEEMLEERPMLLLKFLPEEFSVADMQALHAAVLAKSRTRRAFYGEPAPQPTEPRIGRMTLPAHKRG